MRSWNTPHLLLWKHTNKPTASTSRARKRSNVSVLQGSRTLLLVTRIKRKCPQADGVLMSLIELLTPSLQSPVTRKLISRCTACSGFHFWNTATF
jgi:hypothetical protein